MSTLINIITSCNWLALMWFAYILLLMVISIFVIYFDKYIPLWIRYAISYGKTGTEPPAKKHPYSIIYWPFVTHVPKRWFTHFYLTATIYCSALMLILFFSYLTQSSFPYFVLFLDIVASSNRNAYDMDPEIIIVAMILMFCQVSRRLYECCFVSVFSPTATMSVGHYVVGMTFYINVLTSILAEAPGFTKQGFDHVSFKRDANWRWYQVLGIVLYFWASWHQHRILIILANLRKGEKDSNKLYEYKIPTGDWFESVSSPHYLAEILIYLSLNILLKFNNSLLLLSWIFSLINQVISAIQSHKYYRKKFPDYPKTRKIIIPGIF